MKQFPLQSYYKNNLGAEIPTLEEVFIRPGLELFQSGSASDPAGFLEELERLFQQNSSVYMSMKTEQLIKIRETFIRITECIAKKIETNE